MWQVGFTAGPVLAAVTTDPGLAIVSDGAFMNVIDTSNGTIVNQEVASGFYGAAAIAYGVIYEGDTAQIGELHAYSAIG